MAYDDFSNRLSATRNGATTKYIYDAFGNLLVEVVSNTNSTDTRHYIHGLGLLAMVITDQTYTYHYNAIGSTIAMTDQGQNMVNKYAYSPFGGLSNMLETVPQPFKFVGQYGIMLEPNGLYYMRARYYDQQTGRFISEDPIGFAGGDVNLYAYVQNNPVRFVDPDGENPLILYAATLLRIFGNCPSPGDGRLSPITTPLLSAAGRGLSTAGGGILKANDIVNNAVNSSYNNYYAPAVDTAFDAAKTALDYIAPKPTATTNADFANGSFPAPAPAPATSSSNGGGGNGC